MEAVDAASLAVHTQDLAKRYGKTVALSGLTMSVRRAEVFGFLGPNGAGKTTAVRILATLMKPDAGRATVGGYDVVADDSVAFSKPVTANSVTS